jgi:hypothetical protein
MQTRAEAIAFLRAAGLGASPRDWSLGESIVVPAGTRSEHRGIELHSRVLYIHPSGADWIVSELSTTSREIRTSSLADACRVTLDLVGVTVPPAD